ncbi:MAG TPA: hypothetical protein VH913_07175, partial [Hyphomicrobiaceae bacterium]
PHGRRLRQGTPSRAPAWRLSSAWVGVAEVAARTIRKPRRPSSGFADSLMEVPDSLAPAALGIRDDGSKLWLAGYFSAPARRR